MWVSGFRVEVFQRFQRVFRLSEGSGVQFLGCLSLEGFERSGFSGFQVESVEGFWAGVVDGRDGLNTFGV